MGRALSDEEFSKLIVGMLEGTYVEGNEAETRRFLELGSKEEMYKAAWVLNRGHADTVSEAVRDMKWRGDLLRAVQADIDAL